MKLILVFLLLLFYTSCNAQSNPTLYLIGDSTMANKPNPEENPERGWGQMVSNFLTENITVKNRAINGRSSKSFLNEGHWNTILDSLRPNDYVFIQFGHNDQKEKDSTRYTNPFTQYRSNLERYINETRAKGAIPILFSSITRRKFNQYGVLIDTHGMYPLVVRMVAKDLNIPFIDLQLLTEQLEISYGVEGSKKLHLHFKKGENSYKPKGVEDNTHLSVLGANLIAALAMDEIEKQNLEFKKFIKH